MHTKVSEIEYEIRYNAEYVTTQEFTKLTAENLAARLKQVDVVNETDFNNTLTTFSKRITSNKTKHLEIQNKLNSLRTKDYNFYWVEFISQIVMDL